MNLHQAVRRAFAHSPLTASTLAAESPVRVTGALGTYAFGIALAVTAFLSIW